MNADYDHWESISYTAIETSSKLNYCISCLITCEEIV